MQIQVQESEYCKLSVSYLADPAKVKAKREEVLAKLMSDAKKIQIPGFRAGRAPVEAIKLRYKKSIEQETKAELTQEAYEDILFETKAKPMFQPHVNHSWLNDSVFECNITFFKRPEIELKQYKGFEIPKPHAESTLDAMVEETLERLRRENGEMSPYGENDFVQVGDTTTMTVSCSADGEPEPNLTQEGMLYDVGNNFFAEFDDNVLGMSPGETREFSVKHDEKTYKFVVEFHMGTKKVPAALDDTLAQKLGLDSFDKLRSEVSGQLSKQVEQGEQAKIKQQVLNRLLEAHDFELPAWLVSMEVNQLVHQYQADWSTLDEKTKESVTEQAKKQLRLVLVLDKIREVEPTSFFTDKEILEKLGKQIEEAGQDPNKVLAELQASNRLGGVVAQMQQEATFQWLIQQSTVVE